MVDRDRAREVFESGLTFLDTAPGTRIRDFLILWTHQPSLGKVPCHTSVFDELEKIVTEELQNISRNRIFRHSSGDSSSISSEAKPSDSERIHPPVLYASSDTFFKSDWFERITHEFGINESSYHTDTGPDYQLFRIADTSMDSPKSLVVFQNISGRLFIQSSKWHRLLLKGPREYNKIAEEVGKDILFPKRIDALYFDGLVFVVRPQMVRDLLEGFTDLGRSGRGREGTDTQVFSSMYVCPSCGEDLHHSDVLNYCPNCGQEL